MLGEAEMQIYVDETGIKGFYKRKYKFKVDSVFDFVNKIKKTNMCDKFFMFNDQQFAGMQQLFSDFYE